MCDDLMRARNGEKKESLMDYEHIRVQVFHVVKCQLLNSKIIVHIHQIHCHTTSKKYDNIPFRLVRDLNWRRAFDVPHTHNHSPKRLLQIIQPCRSFRIKPIKGKKTQITRSQASHNQPKICFRRFLFILSTFLSFFCVSFCKQ